MHEKAMIFENNIKRMMGVLISVIVPVYNIEDYLPECLESIIRQDYTNLEIIIVDDGSLDSSGYIADCYAKKDNRIRVIHKENGGLVSARKAGVSVAKGEYITFVDGDDWINEEMYCEMLKACEEHLPDIITSGVIREYGDNTEIEYDCCEPGYYDEVKLETKIFPIALYTGRFYEAGINIHIYNKLFRRKLLEDEYATMPDEINVGEDAAIVYPCVYRAKSIQVVGNAYYHYRIRPGSIMDKQNDDEKGKIDRLEKYLKKSLEDKNFKHENGIKAVIMYLRLLQCPGDIIHSKKDGTIYPFSPLKEGSRIVIHGKGRFAKLLNYILENNCSVEIVNKDIVANKESIYKLPNDSYDYIVVAVLKANIRDKIKKELLSHEIRNDCILSIDENFFEGM